MEGHRHTYNRSALAGAGAGLVTSIAGCPLDVIKTRLQAQELARGTIGYRGVLGTS
jgi:solute carrier family 25 folate transporter 32